MSSTADTSLVPLSVMEIGTKCVLCRKCLTDCHFLTENGPPGQLARKYLQDGEPLRHLAFSCSLCNLCTKNCPVDLEPGRMFLDMRREAVRLKNGHYNAHKRLLAYEKLGSSSLFRYLSLPPGCTTLFFPGCALPGARPDHTLRMYRQLQKYEPTMGIMLDCCNKPSHDLGRHDFFEDRFNARAKFLSQKGIQKIVTGCPNCQQAFSLYARDFSITTAYSVLADRSFVPPKSFHGVTCTIHDPCSTRFDQEIHTATRTITRGLGIQIFEMEHNRETTLCCGEGGAAGCMGGNQAAAWGKKRHDEAAGQLLLTYCAGCTGMLHHHGRVLHIVDLLFPETNPIDADSRQVTSPMTWINRLKLKLKLRVKNVLHK